MLKSLKLLIIAKAVHAVNAAYSLALGDDSHKSWDESSEQIQNSAISGVEFALDNPDAPASAQHDAWTAQKLADGWVYGEEKNEELKTHPCLVPFEELPVELQAKDFIFRAVVKSVSEGLDSIPDPVAAAPVQLGAKEPAAAVQQSGVPLGYTAITYIGNRETYREGTYGTGITWDKGETKLVPNDIAFKLLNHKDVYAKGTLETAETAEVKTSPNKDDDKSEEAIQSARDAVANMDVESLRVYAATNFSGHKLPPKIGVEKARIAVIGLIDQFGVV